MPAALAPSSALPIAAAFDGRYGDAVDLLGDQVVDDLHLLVAPAMLAGSDVQAFDGASSSFSAFLQPSRAWSKNGLFVFFGHQGEHILLGLCVGALGHGEDGRRRYRRRSTAFQSWRFLRLQVTAAWARSGASAQSARLPRIR